MNEIHHNVSIIFEMLIDNLNVMKNRVECRYKYYLVHILELKYADIMLRMTNRQDLHIPN